MRPRPQERRAVVRLPDGRRLSYTDVGPPDGVPVLYCHGAIGTSLDATLDIAQLTARLGVRCVAPSRPGIGGSDPQPGRALTDFAADVLVLADELRLERFFVVGVSAGGPYALALAHALGERVLGVAVCSSLSPGGAPHRTAGVRRRTRWALAFLAAHPEPCRRVGDLVLPLLTRHPGIVGRVIAAHADPGERARLAREASRTAVCQSFLEAAGGGVDGLIGDYLTYVSGWGFELREVAAEVHIWHGARDPLVPVEHAMQMAAALPRCQVFIDPAEGHHFFRSSLEEILGTLLTVQRPARHEAPKPGIARRRGDQLLQPRN